MFSPEEPIQLAEHAVMKEDVFIGRKLCFPEGK